MAGQSTLIVSTRSTGRPTGPGGALLHDSAPQLRRVVRRRLGDATADLLADPRPLEDGTAIDWYADWPGEVRPMARVERARRAGILTQVDQALAEVRRLGETLAQHGGVEDAGLIGRSLQLAGRHPGEASIYLVGDRPVVVAWGYERSAVPVGAPPTARRSVLSPAPPAVVPRPLATAASVPWVSTLLLALPLIALLLGGAWLLREILPDDPALGLSTLEGPLRAPAAEPPPDPFPALKASLSTEEERSRALRVALASLESDLRKRVADCKPPDPPKPPQVAVAPPPPKPAPPPPEPPRPAPQRRPGDDRLRLPTAPTTDYSFLQGCWRTDPFRHEHLQNQPGISSYCFDGSGRGQLEWRRGRTACRTSAQARFDGSALRLRDSDTRCNDGSTWYADQLVCQRGADNVALCSGSSRGPFGPVTWSVNLHKLQ